ISFTFNKVAKATTVSVPSTTACGAATVQLSADDFTTCVAGTSTSSSDGITWSLTPGTLAGSTPYKLRISGVHDANDVAMGAAVTVSFTTAPGLAVVSLSPADGSDPVSLLPAISGTV